MASSGDVTELDSAAGPPLFVLVPDGLAPVGLVLGAGMFVRTGGIGTGAGDRTLTLRKSADINRRISRTAAKPQPISAHRPPFELADSLFS